MNMSLMQFLLMGHLIKVLFPFQMCISFMIFTLDAEIGGHVETLMFDVSSICNYILSNSGKKI